MSAVFESIVKPEICQHTDFADRFNLLSEGGKKQDLLWLASAAFNVAGGVTYVEGQTAEGSPFSAYKTNESDDRAYLAELNVPFNPALDVPAIEMHRGMK